MTEQEIIQKAEEYANSMYDKKYQNELWKECYMIHIAGAHSRDEEVTRLSAEIEDDNYVISKLQEELNKLRNPWISVTGQLPKKK